MIRKPGQPPLWGNHQIPLSGKTGLMQEINDYLVREGKTIEKCMRHRIYHKYSFQRFIEADEVNYAIDFFLLEKRVEDAGKSLVMGATFEVPLKTILSPIISRRNNNILIGLTEIGDKYLYNTYSETYIRDGNTVLVGERIKSPVTTGSSFETADMMIKATERYVSSTLQASFVKYTSKSIVKEYFTANQTPKELTLEDYMKALPEWLERNKDK